MHQSGYTDIPIEGITSLVLFNNRSDRGGVSHVLQLSVNRNLTLQKVGPDGRFSVVATVLQPAYHSQDDRRLQRPAGCRLLLGDFDLHSEGRQVLTCPDGRAQREVWLL